MHLFVRVDADAKIGIGHIMRCIALAQAWQERGGSVAFISRCESDALISRIAAEGFSFFAVDKSHPHKEDLEHTLRYLGRPSIHGGDLSPGWFVLDGYYFDTEYQKAVTAAGYRLLVVDDMNHLTLYHADIILNQNINAPGLLYRCGKEATLLLGTSYVLLRREFRNLEGFERRVPGKAKNILVTLGGGDPENITLEVIEALKCVGGTDISARIVIGPANTHRDSLLKAVSGAHFEAEILTNPPPNMPDLMVWADMAVSGGGSTCWELALLKLPNIIIYCAENQKPVAERLHAEGMALNLGRHGNRSFHSLTGAIEQVINSQSLRKKMSLCAEGIIDGQGAVRVCQVLEDGIKANALTAGEPVSPSYPAERGDICW